MFGDTVRKFTVKKISKITLAVISITPQRHTFIDIKQHLTRL